MNRTWPGVLLVMTFSLALLTPVGAEEKSGGSGTAPAADTEVKRITGQLTHIEGWHYTIKDSRGKR